MAYGFSQMKGLEMKMKMLGMVGERSEQYKDDREDPMQQLQFQLTPPADVSRLVTYHINVFFSFFAIPKILSSLDHLQIAYYMPLLKLHFITTALLSCFPAKAKDMNN